MHHLCLSDYHTWRASLAMPCLGTTVLFVEGGPIKHRGYKIKAGSTWVLTSLKKTEGLPADAECVLTLLSKKHTPGTRTITITVEHMFGLIDFGKLVITLS